MALSRDHKDFLKAKADVGKVSPEGPVVCPVNEEAGATGAAIQACWCYATETVGEKVSIVEITNKFIQLDDTTRSDPSAETVKVYNEVYKNFTTFNRILEPNYPVICMSNLS